MACLGTFGGWRLFSWASTLSLIAVVVVVIRMNSPAVGLDGAQRIFDSLLVALWRRLRLAFALGEEVQLPSHSLLVSCAPRVDNSGLAVCALVYFGYMVGLLVVADNVLPRVALFA